MTRGNFTACDAGNVDVLVVGAGIAGLTAALAAQEDGASVRLIAKSEVCASDHLLGFNAPVGEGDSAELFFDDTMRGGGQLNAPALVRLLTEGSRETVKILEDMGLSFDKEGNGYDLLKPLGCTVPRLVHIGNSTGKTAGEAFRRLLSLRGIEPEYGVSLAEVTVSDEETPRVTGAVLFDRNSGIIEKIRARAVVLAAGGIHLMTDSTYDLSMTGDGMAAAYRAGAALCDMGRYQFEPCRCIYPKKLGISTTLLASGGKLTNRLGERFLLKNYRSEGDVPKDALALAVAKEVREGRGTGHGGVYLDLTGIPADILRGKHVMYWNRFRDAGIDLSREIIEVGPAAHSFMGGVKIDASCRTTVPGLLAAGETAGGVHGANRVGGNAGSEVFVFGRTAGRAAAEDAKRFAEPAVPDKPLPAFLRETGTDGKAAFEAVKTEIQAVMSAHMGPLREKNDCAAAAEKLDEIGKRLAGMLPADFEARMSATEAVSLWTVCRRSAEAV